MKRKRKSKGPYVAVPIAIMSATAWRTMSPEGRLLWIELRSRVRNDGLNNGKIFRSCRDAAKALGLHKDTVARRYAENEHYGFLRKTSEGFLGSDGRGIAARYRFTDLAYGTHAATRDFETWDGSIFTSREGRKKTETRPTAKDTPSYRVGHTEGREWGRRMSYRVGHRRGLEVSYRVGHI
jgi:DNA-binding transcriptional MocR family regulator